MFLSYRPARFGWDLDYTFAVMVWFLACVAVLYLIVWDQRYRCRVCLRRLRMPILTGSRSTRPLFTIRTESPAIASAGTTMAEGFSRTMILASTDIPIRSGVSFGSRR